MSQIDYKSKYMNLKAKFMNTTDLAWRLGYEQGLKDAQLDQLQQQQMQNDAMAQSQAGASQLGQESADPTKPEEQPTPISQNPNGDELDQHINKLESMLGKSEISSLEIQDLKKTLSDIRSLQVQINLTKSLEGIKNTKLAKSQAPFKLTPKLEANLTPPAQKALTLQHKIVGDIFKKWSNDESKTSNEISSILDLEGIIKRDDHHE